MEIIAIGMIAPASTYNPYRLFLTLKADIKIIILSQAAVVHAFISSNWESETGGSLRFQGQSGLQEHFP